MAGVLRMRSGGVVRMRDVAGDSIVAGLSAVETIAFLDTFGMFSGGKFG